MALEKTELKEFAPGVWIRSEYSTGVNYVGAAEAIVAAGLIDPAWLEGISHLSRVIVRRPDGGFLILAEGKKGNRLTRSHRDAGAVTIRRRPDNTFDVCVRRNDAARKAYDAAEKARWADRREKEAADQQREAWELAKVAHGNEGFAERWKSGVLNQLGEVERLIDGRLIYQGFPEISLSDQGVERARLALNELRDVLKQSTPIIKDREQVSNVISLRGAAYRFMKCE